MNKRRQYLINRKFQLKYTFSILGFMFIATAIIIGLIGINAAHNNGQMSEITLANGGIIKSLERTMTTQDNILSAVLTWVQNPRAIPSKTITQDIAKSHYKEIESTKSNIKTIKENIAVIKETINYNTMLIIAIVVIVIIQGIVFYIMMIRKTHKIAGPAYVMQNYCKEIIEGKYPDTRELRAGDELQELYDTFSKMVEKLKAG